MGTKMQMSMRMDQRLMMSQQLKQAISLLQYNTLDLKQLIQQYIETNPLLEIEEDEDKESSEEITSTIDEYENYDTNQMGKPTAELSNRSQFTEDDGPFENYSIPKSLRSHLLEQSLLYGFNPAQQIIAEAIIDSIDDNGFLTMSLHEIQYAINNKQPPEMAEVEAVLQSIQMFDPLGVGAKDLQECLLIQLNHMSEKNRVWEIACSIVKDHLVEASHRNSKNLIKILKISESTYKEAMLLIRTLNPQPGMQYSSAVNYNIEPELHVKKVKNEWKVFLSDSILTSVKINNQYKNIIKQNRKHNSYEALKQELNEARGLLYGLKRRNETLLAVGTCIVELQKNFLELGLTAMKPMNIVDVAMQVDVHESTISRITTGKFIDTPRGIFELKYFFTNQVSDQAGKGCSAMAVKEHIRTIISNEANHVFSDDEITEILAKKGIQIARRTVAKYRTALKILPSYQRVKDQMEEVV